MQSLPLCPSLTFPLPHAAATGEGLRDAYARLTQCRPPLTDEEMALARCKLFRDNTLQAALTARAANGEYALTDDILRDVLRDIIK